jgi:predicted ATPase
VKSEMMRIAERAKFIGRYNEITELASDLESAVMGKGQIVFISGEAGIGKTRFINQVRSLPIGQRFNWLSTQCIYQEGTDAYLPFVDALRDWVDPESIDEDTEVIPIVERTQDMYSLDNLAKMPVIGPKLIEDPAMSFGSFMVKEPKSEFCLGVLKTLIANGRKALCITRLPPEQLGDWTKTEGLKYYWLSSKPGKECLPPSLTKISHEIREYLKMNPNSIILLDGIEYILGHLEFNQVLRFANELVDSMAINKSILLIPINPLTIDPKQLALFERNMNSIDIGDIEKPPAEPESKIAKLENTYKFIEEELQNGRDRMFEKTTQTILNLASIKPVIFFIDDLHWADEGALHLLHYLARAIKNYKVAIIGTYRSEDLANIEEPHPLQALLDRLVPEKLIRLISLERLDITETGDMIRSLLQSTDFPEKLVEFLFNETEGNPFFIEEVLRSLEEEGIIAYVENQNSWILTKDILEIKIPETIRDVVHARIGRLSKNMRLVLDIASVLGEEFEYDILSAVWKLNEEELVTNLDDLIRYKILIEQPTTYGQPIKYKFAHNKIGEVLYGGLGQSHRRLLHAKAAVSIEDKYKNNLDSVIYELAQHSYHGGDYNRSLEYTIKAGDKALLDFAPEKAKAFNQWALDSIELVNAHTPKTTEYVKTQLDVLTKLYEICSLIGEWDEALKYTKPLLEISEEHKDNEKISETHIYIGRINSHRSNWPDAIKHLNQALNIAKNIDYQKGLMEAYYELGKVHERLGEFQKAEECFQQFMDIVSSSGSNVEIARGFESFARIYHNRGDYKTAIEYYQKGLDLLTTTANYKELAKIYTNLGVDFFELDEFDKVIDCHEKCIEYASRVGDIRAMGYGYSNAAEVYANKLELDIAMDYVKKAIEIFTKLDEKHMIGLSLMNYGIIYKNKQDWDSSSYYFEKSIALLKDINVPTFLADCNRQYGLMYAKQDTPKAIEKGKEYLQNSLDIYKDLGINKYIDVVQIELNQLDNRLDIS